MGLHRITKDYDSFNKTICAQCHKEFELEPYINNPEILKVMREHSICFTCAFWKPIINKKLDYTVVDGKCYLINQTPIGLTTQDRFTKRHYLMNADFKTKYLGIIRFFGDVPDYLRELLPDEGIFVSRKIFYKALSGFWKCNCKGCWDRYHCLRYDINIEKDGPWNTVPDDHIIGDEGCYSFIDKKIFSL